MGRTHPACGMVCRCSEAVNGVSAGLSCCSVLTVSVASLFVALARRTFKRLGLVTPGAKKKLEEVGIMRDHESRFSGMDDESLERLGRRLAAAYISYIAGRKRIDPTLKEFADRKAGPLWVSLADFVFWVMKSGNQDLQLREAITK